MADPPDRDGAAEEKACRVPGRGVLLHERREGNERDPRHKGSVREIEPFATPRRNSARDRHPSLEVNQMAQTG
jgi:hypothetical protein